MSHRVIAGTAKGRRLKLVPGDSTRPIMDRAKEALFSIIGREIYGARFLDLFAGTGSVGIEALSRGAMYVLFTEMNGQAIRTINDNLRTTGLEEGAAVRRTDALAMIKGRAPLEPYDFIFVAPPQYHGIWKTTLEILDSNREWVSGETTVIVQIDPNEYEQLELSHLNLVDERKYGKTMLLFYEQSPDESEAIDE